MKHKISEAEKRRAFFYAEADADVYDPAADLSTPHYSLMHAQVLELVQREIRSLRKARGVDEMIYILDLGSGTGAESMPLVVANPDVQLVAVDFCEPMHERYRSKLMSSSSDPSILARCTFITADICEAEAHTAEILAPVLAAGGTVFDIAISALALHHLDAREKRAAFDWIGRHLGPRGLFVNADLFSFQCPELTEIAHEHLISWIDRQFRDPDLELRAAANALGERREALRASWIEHCNSHNVPDPIEGAANSVAGASATGSNEGQAAMLRTAGFAEVGCPFRVHEVGILWARRGDDTSNSAGKKAP